MTPPDFRIHPDWNEAYLELSAAAEAQYPRTRTGFVTGAAGTVALKSLNFQVDTMEQPVERDYEDLTPEELARLRELAASVVHLMD